MATLNELGRNSASITYGPSATGAESWPAFALVDQWLRNDTLQGYATAASSTVTGVGTIYTTQVRAGDVIMIAGQMRTVLAVASDTSFTVTVAFSPAITVASAVKVINTTLSGTVSVTARGSTTGVVSVVNGSATITGVGTLFTSEATNSNTDVASVIGRQITINGRVRTITSFANDTSITVNAAMDFTDSNLNYKVLPRGTIAITAGSSTVTGTSTNFGGDLQNGDQIVIGDEIRTITTTTNTAATITASTFGTVAALTQAVTGISFRPDNTYITGTGTSFTTELRIGDDLIINGTEVTVTNILSDTLFRINFDFPKTISGATIYKKKKIHGYVLEGSREGAGTGNRFTTQTTSVLAAGNTYPAGNTTVTVALATGFSQFGFIKVVGGGGPSQILTGTATAGTNTVTGVNTLFTTELHVGAEIMCAGQYLTVTAIASNTSLTVSQTVTISTGSPIYRTTPLYTYIASVSSAIMTLGTPLKNTIYSTGANPPGVHTVSAATDFLEYVYSAPNKTAEATTTLFNTSLDRKYVGFRFYPFAQGGGSGTAITTAGCAYNLTVYERWVAAYGGANGVGINKADLSDSASAISGVTDQTSASVTTGGFFYLFAKPRYFLIQGKNFANTQLPWLGCVEFERAQPEDTGTGLGTTTGVNYSTGAPVSGTPGVSPWPCFAYFHGNRFPVGSTQTPTLPIAHAQGVHGGIFATPRVRCSTGDLVGINAHIYSAATITTGRWGHLFELGGSGSYTTPGANPTAGALTLTANTMLAPHMGHLVPTYTNVYNSKRFMFSPVVVLGPAYDPDIRGRIYGLKVIPSSLGTLMDTVSVTTDSNDFYDSTQSATDHWVVTAAVQTYKVYMAATTQSTRSLEDPTPTGTANTVVTYQNSFRWAVPA
jgi:hypothetical protein